MDFHSSAKWFTNANAIRFFLSEHRLFAAIRNMRFLIWYLAASKISAKFCKFPLVDFLRLLYNFSRRKE